MLRTLNNQSDETTFISEHPGVAPAQASRDTFDLKKLTSQQREEIVDITTTRIIISLF